ncbi:MAG: hypothetical protein GY841_02670 [FCB group bacterium]|nr:hypothetical protein [FCB group bacterium]
MKTWKLLGLGVLALALVLFIGCGKAEEKPAADPTPEPVEVAAAVDHTPTAEEIGTEITCAACGMAMTVTETMPAAMYEGQTYFFCNAEEKAAFIADPAKLLTTPDSVKTEVEEGSTH